MKYINIQECIVNSLQHKSRLTTDILEIEGLSSHKVKHLLNNLNRCSETYLEIGSYKGSTMLAACYNNSDIKPLYSVDDFSGFGGPKNELLANLDMYLNNYNYKMIEKKFQELTFDDIPENYIDLYFYDGDHNHIPQYEAIVEMKKFMQNEFVLVVDDWNYPEVQSGTRAGITDAALTVTEEYILPASFTGDTNMYWNGVYIARVFK